MVCTSTVLLYSEQVHKFVKRQLDLMGSVPFVWLVASRRDGVYWWPDGTQLTNGSAAYTAWLESAPPDFSRDGCVRMARSSAQGKWTTERCSDVGAYICEIALSTPPAKTLVG